MRQFLSTYNFMKKFKANIPLFILIFSITSTVLINYFLNNKFSLLKNLYFYSPLIIKREKICPLYNKLLKKHFDQTFSATIIDNEGFKIASLNENELRKPASNLKLFSTAYVLSKYRDYHTLKTSIYKDRDDNFHLIGNGDPDLNYNDIKQILSRLKFDNFSSLFLHEIVPGNNYPKGWTAIDKKYNYGSPITSLALHSNEKKDLNIYYLKNQIEKYLEGKYPDKKIYVSIVNYKYKKNLTLIESIESNPIISLVTLANAESHNFSSESLFKSASKTWNKNKYNKLKIWISRRGLPVNGIRISDASGLSRDNRLTTKLVAEFLHKMKFNNDFDSYISTLSIMGTRGTLARRLANTEIKNKFFGKSGTLSNTAALSGYLNKMNKSLTISIIQNSNLINTNKIDNFIIDLYKSDECSN